MQTKRIKRIEVIDNHDVYDIHVRKNHNFVANGIVVHNCVEISLYPVSETGEHGFQFCNLTEINGRFCSTEERFLQACRASAIIGTLQAAYTDFKYLSPATRQITEREALLGCSITGMMDNPDILFNSEIQCKGAEEIRKVNERIAKVIGINQAARCTAIKPAGCVSPETNIRTNRGNMSVEEIFLANGSGDILKDAKESGKYNIWIENKTDIQVLNEYNELEDISKLYINGYDETFTVTTEDGVEVVLTGQHKVQLSNGEWVRVDTLKEGDDIKCYNA